MELSFLPTEIKSAISRIDNNNLYEIRLRTGFAVSVNIKGKKHFLSKNGVCKKDKDSIICTDNHIKEIICNVTEHSIYAYNDCLKNGFLTTKIGVRIGVAGEVVYAADKPLTIKNISSLNLRIPHFIKDCSGFLYKYLKNEQSELNNLLIISPPTCGKTTILKDLALKINDCNDYQVLIIDERGEFAEVRGKNIDSVKYCDKSYAFNYGLRSLSPNVVVTDELSGQADWQCVYNAVNSGVKIIASCHADGIKTVRNNAHFIGGVFDIYAVLKNKSFAGEVVKLYDKDFKLIYDSGAV